MVQNTFKLKTSHGLLRVVHGTIKDYVKIREVKSSVAGRDAVLSVPGFSPVRYAKALRHGISSDLKALHKYTLAASSLYRRSR
jgi:hypothetical protein